MEVREEDEAFVQPAVLGTDGLLHLEQKLGVGPHVVDRADPRTRRLVRRVGERAPLAGAGLDDDIVPALPELPRPCRGERDAVLVGLDLSGNTDLHGASPYLVDESAGLRRCFVTNAPALRG